MRRPRLKLRRRFLAWLRSLHAKLFLVVATVTSLLTIAVAVQVTRNSRKEFYSYSKGLAVEICEAVETEIQQRDPEFKNPRKIEEVLESLASPERSVFQVDVFRAEGRDRVSLVTSSADDDAVDWSPELGAFMTTPGPSAELVPLNTGSQAWEIHMPIRNPHAGRPPLGLVRTYCDLQRWEVIWKAYLNRTLRYMPLLLLGEFIFLWVITSVFVKDPLRAITEAMSQLEQGDASARAKVNQRNELGHIADRFNAMASELERSAREREALLGEVRSLNAGLQERIDEALAELQAKNQELELQVERNALLREELAQQERLAVAGQLTAAFAHEVGTPLNLVNSHLQLLLQGKGELPDKARERLSTIHAQIERVGDIVRRLLGHTRRPKLQQEPVELAALLSDLQRLWQPTFQTHRIQFEVLAPEPCPLYADRKQMEQLFINLVNNAVDAMPGGGAIRLMAEADPVSPVRWSLWLEDQGQGIPAGLLSKVFKPMFTTKPEGKGTGLGLPICREIVRGHGGEIRIESREGEGTRVGFTLPRYVAEV